MKMELFSPTQKFRREGFMTILVDLWPSLASKQTIQKSWKESVNI